MLQFASSYADAHRYRLGATTALPVNRSHVLNHHRDGHAVDGNERGQLQANSFGGPTEDHAYKEPPLKIDGDADRYDHRVGNDDFTQAGNLYRLMPADQRDRLHKAIAGAMAGVPKEIIERQLAHFAKADKAYAEGVKKALGW
jgi:catalase